MVDLYHIQMISKDLYETNFNCHVPCVTPGLTLCHIQRPDSTDSQNDSFLFKTQNIHIQLFPETVEIPLTCTEGGAPFSFCYFDTFDVVAL